MKVKGPVAYINHYELKRIQERPHILSKTAFESRLTKEKTDTHTVALYVLDEDGADEQKRLP